MPKSPGEWARFEALLRLTREIGRLGDWEIEQSLNLPISNPQSLNYSFRPSVLVQQIFSLLKQSPTGSIRLADLRRIAPPQVTSEEIRQIVSHLTFDGYLQSGRLGEWRPAEKLQILIDQHEIYSNIGMEVMGVTAVDAHTGHTLAHTERPYPINSILLFGGKPMKVVWVEKYRFGLAAAEGQQADEILRFQKSYAAIPFVVTQTVARSLGIQAGQMALLPGEEGAWLFPFWGTVWGELLTAVLIANGISAEFVNEYCLFLRQPISQLPLWEEKVAQKAAKETAVTLANRLQMGRFHRQLPANVALTAVLCQLNLEQLSQRYRTTTFISGEHLQAKLNLLAT
jgi:hypothetical protein